LRADIYFIQQTSVRMLGSEQSQVLIKIKQMLDKIVLFNKM